MKEELFVVWGGNEIVDDNDDATRKIYNKRHEAVTNARKLAESHPRRKIYVAMIVSSFCMSNVDEEKFE